jgi:hypothetical protein
MEYWSIGVLDAIPGVGSITPLLHYSITPLLHYSNTPFSIAPPVDRLGA